MSLPFNGKLDRDLDIVLSRISKSRSEAPSFVAIELGTTRATRPNIPSTDFRILDNT
jgi:hypothetical protein